MASPMHKQAFDLRTGHSLDDAAVRVPTYDVQVADGLISIEDLIEMVVGDIEDEHDVAEGRLVQRVEGEAEVFVADARADHQMAR